MLLWKVQVKMSERMMMKGTCTRNDSCASGMRSEVVVILGAEWGDEGKGKMVDLLCQGADVVCRCQVCNVLLNSVETGNVSSEGGKVATTCCPMSYGYNHWVGYNCQ